LVGVSQMKSVLAIKGEKVYYQNRAKLEKAYPGKIVAIETESGSIAGIGTTLDEAYDKALKKYPRRKFYFRKVGPCPAPTYLF
jgi:peptide subunit release factor RF-3